MIHDLDTRRKHWDDPRNRAPREEHDLADSLPYPFEPVEGLFAGKDVLEIGPGRGRQYNRLKSTVRSYSICDISSDALNEPVFAGVSCKLFLTDYTHNFRVCFDVVHFWYVLHHIRADELDPFFAFVARHLHKGGYALFNTPIIDNPTAFFPGDGIGTTCIDQGMVRTAYRPYLETVDVYAQNDRSSGDLFVTRKR